MITANHSDKRDRQHEWRARSRQFAACVIAGLPMLVHGADPPRTDGHETVIADTQIEQALDAPKTRGLMVRGRTETKQMIDLNIPFEFNSSELRPQATAQLRQLQSALTSESLTLETEPTATNMVLPSGENSTLRVQWPEKSGVVGRSTMC